MTPEVFDYVVVGGGMAGVSSGYYFADIGTVLLLEAEPALAYHTTGRSAAMYVQTYGNEVIRRLTVGCHAFYTHPPDGFSDAPLLTTRGALQYASEARLPELDRVHGEVRRLAPAVQRLDGNEVRELVPVLRSAAAVEAIYEPDAMDMDVHAIHQGFLRGLRAKGGRVVTNACVSAMRRSGEIWHVDTARESFRGKVIVNAAGAWGDSLAELAGARPVALVPKRRTAIQFSVPEDVVVDSWPLCIDIDEEVYFKPDVGCLMASPADETPSPPCDAQPDELDVAVAADRVQRVTNLKVDRILHSWAGLRTFAADKTPVVGHDPVVPGFFWVVGQGGYGIQTAPSMGRVAAGLAGGAGIPADLAVLGIKAEHLSPGRCY